ETFPVGGSKTLRSHDDDQAALVAAGVTLVQATKAADALEAAGIAVRVIDAYSVKPIDAATLRTAFDVTGLVVTVEDHRIEGGLGDAVLAALAETGPMHGTVKKLGVTQMPGSGTADELRAWAKIDAAAIERTVREVLDA
ncbi:MAG: transketolase, partial [Actinomycetota bacterium]|nr:transketolase [Actinomycetota bacterium]